jgi:hypothetical protein
MNNLNLAKIKYSIQFESNLHSIKTNYINPKCHIYITQSSTLPGEHESKEISLVSLAIATFNSRVGRGYKISLNFFQKVKEIAKTFNLKRKN